jgi:hypothetical protein
VGNIVDSLFADYLPRKQQAPVGVADPRQQTMLTNQMLTPVMNKPVTPPNNYSINPPVNPLRSEFTQPTTQPPVENNRPIYSNNPPIAPDYGFTQPTTEPPVENNRPIYSNNPPIAPDYGFTEPTQPPAPVVNNRPIYSNNPPIAPDYGFTEPTQPTPPTEEAPEFASVGGIGGGVVPTEEEEETTDPFASSFERTPFDLMADAEEGSRVQADPVDTVYDGDNRPTYIKEVVGLDADTYNKFLSEFDDAVAQGNLDYRQQVIKARADQEASGTRYTDQSDRVTQNRYAERQAFETNVKEIADAYGVPLSYTTKGGDRWELNSQGKYTKTLDVGGFKDMLPDLIKAGIFAVATAGIGGAIGGALQLGTAGTSALTGALGSLVQGGDPKDAILAAVTGGISGGLTDAVGKALGVSKDIATGITQAGLAAAQGAGSKEALLSGFLAGVGEYIRGELPAANQDPDQFGFKGKNPDIPLDGADAATGSAEAWSNALKGAETFAATPTGADTKPPEIFVGRTTGTPAIDTTAAVTQPVTTTPTIPTGGMLTKDTPAGELEEVTVRGRMVTLDGMEAYVASNGFMLNPQTLQPIGRQLVEGKDGVIRFIDADDKMLNDYGSAFAKGFQDVHGADRWLELLNGVLAGKKYTVFGNEITYDKLFGDDPSRKVADVTQEETQPEQPEGASLPDKPTTEDVEPQPTLPPDEAMEIPEFEIENLPPEFNAEIPEVVTPPVTPETPVVPRPTEGGGGGGSAGGVVVPPPATPPATPPPAAPEAPTDEVVDVFDDGGLTGDAFEDSTVEDTEEAEDVAVDVTDTEEYRDLQEELNTTRANQETLETTVAGLQDEVAAANAAAKQAQEAAAAAEAAGAANADKLRGEAVAAQANAERVQNELDDSQRCTWECQLYY